MNAEEYEDTKYDVDVKKSLFANIGFFLFLFLVLIFIFKTISIISNIEDPNIQLIGLMAFMYSVVKLFYRFRFPTVYFKEKIVKGKIE